MYIVSWNVNSIRVRAKMIRKLIDEHDPSFILLQETKCIDSCFPHEIFPEYISYIAGQKSYNGVAILCKKNLIIQDFQKIQICDNSDARCIYIVYNNICIVNVYVPCGDEKNILPKVEFMNNFASFIGKLHYSQIIAGGDYNVALYDSYVETPKLFRNTVLCMDVVRAGFQNILNAGLIDPANEIKYTWWDYRSPRGVKIDYILTKGIKGNLITLQEYRQLRLEDHNGKKQIEIGPSDHVPLILNIDEANI